MRDLQISQMPVLDKNVCIGMITDKIITILLSKDTEIGINKKMLDPMPPKVQHNVPARTLRPFFNFYDYVLVEKDKKIYGLIATEDFNKFLEEEREKKGILLS